MDKATVTELDRYRHRGHSHRHWLRHMETLWTQPLSLTSTDTDTVDTVIDTGPDRCRHSGHSHCH